MTFALIGLLVLALVVFAFVLEPILRARGDRVELDAAALTPLPESPTGDDELLVAPDERVEDHEPERDAEARPAPAVERRVVGDVS